jgi:hypothetical protein
MPLPPFKNINTTISHEPVYSNLFEFVLVNEYLVIFSLVIFLYNIAIIYLNRIHKTSFIEKHQDHP